MADILPITAAWGYERQSNCIGLQLSLGDDDCRYEGTVHRNGTLMTDHFVVKEELRDQGIGTRVFRAAVALAKLKGIDNMNAFVTSPYSLKIRNKIFGESMVIADAKTGIPLPMSVDQAIESIERAKEFYRTNPYSAHRGLGVICSLSKIDTLNWELPVEVSI